MSKKKEEMVLDLQGIIDKGEDKNLPDHAKQVEDKKHSPAVQRILDIIRGK